MEGGGLGPGWGPGRGPGRGWGRMLEETRTCECRSLSGSDGSVRPPLSSRRTNYEVIDSGLITGAASGFKLAGWWRRACRDGEGGVGVGVLRRDNVGLQGKQALR